MGSGNYFYPLKREFLNLSGGTVTGDTLFTANLSASTIFSGSTNLGDLLNSVVSGGTRITNGINTFTAGTLIVTSVNITGGSFNNLYTSGETQFFQLSATTLSGGTIFSGSTPLSTVINNSITAITSTLTSTRVQNGLNTYTGGTADLPTVNISAATLNNLTVSGNTSLQETSTTSLSANTFYSGSTDINIFFNQDRAQITTKVNRSGDTFTGQINAPSLSATTLSGGTIYSGNTNIENIINNYINDLDDTYVSKIYTTNDLDLVWSSGSIEGFGLTDNLNGTVTISSGITVLRSGATQYDRIESFTISGNTTLTLTDNSVNYIYTDYNAGSPIVTFGVSVNSFNCLDKCLLYKATRSGNTIYWLFAGEQNVDSNRKLRRRYLESENLFRANGLIISSSGLTINTTAGITYFGLTEHSVNAFDTNISDIFTQIYNSGSTWFYSTGTTINNTQYNNNGTLTTLPLGRYRADFVYMLIDSPDKLYIYLGDNSLTLAQAQQATTPASLPIELQNLGILIGRIIIRRNGASLTEVASAFDITFNPTNVTNHNDLSGLQGGTADEYFHLTSSEYTDLQNISTTYLPLSGGVLTGGLTGTSGVFNSLSAITISATTYYNLPTNAFTADTTNNAIGANYTGITSNNNYTFVVGQGNQATGVNDAAVGGLANTASGQISFVGGGQSNTTSNIYAGIIGGLNNTNAGQAGFIGGGSYNSNVGTDSFIGGGNTNVILGGNNNAILGGGNNIISGSTSNSVILGGNIITGTSSNTVYVPYLNIVSANTDNTLTNILVRDINGEIKLSNLSNITSNYLPLSGGTLSGGLTLAGDISLTSGNRIISTTGGNLRLNAASGNKIRFDVGGNEYANITNTLATFNIPISATTLSALTYNMPVTTASTVGVIYKDGDRFIHNFKHPSGGSAVPDGQNTFIGVNAGNFTMGSTAQIAAHSSYNTAIGVQSLALNVIGYQNTAIGYFSLRNNTSGYTNVAIGNSSLQSNTTGANNVAIGSSSLVANTIGVNNVSVGYATLFNLSTGNDNIAIGTNTGRWISGLSVNLTASTSSIFIGSNTVPLANNQSNQIVIGHNVIGNGSNTVTIGSSGITNNYFSGNLNLKNNTNIYGLDSAGTSRTILNWSNGDNISFNGRPGVTDIYLNPTVTSSAGFVVKSNGDVGIGVVTPLAKLHILKTSEQLRIGYDNSNYITTVVASTGEVTQTLNGTTKKLNLSSTGSTVLQINSSVVNTYLGTDGSGGYVGTNNVYNFRIYAGNIERLSFAPLSGACTVADGLNFIYGTSSGTKIGTATNQKLAFWNATPIVQPTTAVAAATFVANTSGIADDTATFDGYTIGQVVKALRNIGVLA